MMTVDDVFNRLKELEKASAFSDSEKSDIESMYTEVLDKKFIKTSCNDCYKDAVFEIYAYLKKNGKMKEKTVYRLKNGVLLQMGFGSGEFFTNSNLTDEAAEKYLAEHPENINFFAVFPDDWKKRVSSRNGKGKNEKKNKKQA